MLDKPNSLIKKIIIFIVVAIVVYASIKELQNMIKEKTEQNQVNEILDRTFEEMNRGYPKEIEPNITIDRIYRENIEIYQIYTNAALTSEFIDLEELERNSQKNVMPEVCSNKTYKEAILHGYSIVFVYNTSDKKDVFRVVSDKNTCAKHW